MSTARSGANKPPDQKKVYMDWANHYLRKAGHSATLSDLKDISDGQFLPQIIQAVVHGEVPGIIATVQSEEDRQRNIEKCIRYLEKTGVNCNTFPPHDICDGNMRAIYSLFYNLSHFKKMSKEVHGEGVASGSHTPSRIARPISPGLKASHGVSGSNSGIPMTSKLAQPSSSSGLSNGSAGMGGASKRNAGSSIAMSSHNFAQRKIPSKSMAMGSHAEGHAHNHAPPTKSQEDSSPIVNGEDVELDSHHQRSRLAKPGSSSSAASLSKDSRLHHSSVSASNIKSPSDGQVRSTPPRSTSLTKLQSPALVKKMREPTRIEERGESPSDKPAHEDGESTVGSRPGSRLKHPSSGRTTPSNMARSGLQRPSSRLAKPGFSGPSASEEQAESQLPKRPDSQLKLQRKGSDGAVKKHRVNVGTSSPAAHSPIESGSNSLPRNLPKGILSSGSGLAAPSNYQESSSKAADLESSGSSSSSHTSSSEAAKLTKKSPSMKKAASASGLRMPSGLSMPTSKSGLTRPSESATSTPLVKEEEEGPQAPPTTSATSLSTSKLAGPMKKMTSASSLPTPSSGSPLSKPKLSRLVGPASTSKLQGLKPHPQVTSLSVAKTTGSTSSLDSCNSDIIKVGVSQKVDEERESVEPEFDKSSDVSVERESDPIPSRPVPKSLEISHNGSSTKEGDILSPPAEFKMLEKTASPRDTRRISPEGMSQEDSNSRTSEALPKTSSEDSHIQLDEPNSISESVERNLKNERESAGDSPSMVLRLTQEEGENVTSNEEKSKLISPTSMSDPKHGSTKIGNETGNKMDDLKVLKSKGFSQPETGQPAMDSPQLLQKSSADAKAANESLSESVEEHRLSREIEPHPHEHGKPRARSLSPKSSHRVGVVGISPTYLPAHMVPAAQGVDFSRTASNEGGRERKPLKSVLRHSNSSAGVGRNTSSSSLEGIPGKSKVTISPRSSQLVYNPEDPALGSLTYHFSPKLLSPDNRPVSFGESSNSDSLSPPGSTLALGHLQPRVGGGRRILDQDRERRGGDITRKESIRSTVSEKLNFDAEIKFLDSRLKSMPSDQLASTPELLESFENQLSSMKMDLANKDRMLNMYETSMADLSSKLHTLRRTLEQKDREIKHLTDEKTTWFDLEGRSLASRAASEAGVLSDGCLSDSAMDQEGKTGKKKKKPWKRFSFRKNKKDGQLDHLSPNIDTESIISTRSSRSLKRNFSNRKTPDLMSISEYTPPDSRFKDLDTKSTYTLDARSEYGAFLPQIGFNDHDVVEIFQDDNPGVKVKVLLQPEVLEAPTSSGPGVNDSGYHSDIFRQFGTAGAHRDSIGSHSDCSSQGECSEGTVPLGMLSIALEASWVTMDTKICDIIMHHFRTIDPECVLGLSDESIQCYSVGEQRRQIGNALLPPITPYEAVAADHDIKILLKGSSQEACDSLAYKTLMNIDTLKSYMDMLRETHWLVVMGTKGTCKTSLATGLARHLSMCLMKEEDVEEDDDELMVTIGGEVMTFNVDKDSLETPLKFIKNDLVRRVQVQTHPPIILLEGVSECETIEKILVAAEAVPKKPYIIATLCSGSAKGIPLHQLLFHHPIRLITCKPNDGHIQGILSRSLRRQIYQHKASRDDVDPVADRLVNWLPFLLEHLNYFINRFHSSVVDLGPRVFMGCPLQLSANEIESWFINLWNHFVIPYLMGAVMAGIETYTADPRLEWIDVKEFVVETYPWQPAINVNKLQTLSPEDVSWNHAVRPQQSRMLYYKTDENHIPEDARSILN